MLRLMDGFSEFFIVIAMSGINIETIEGKVTKRKPHPSRLRGRGECAKAHSFLCDCRWSNKRRAGRCAPAGWYEKEVFQKKFFFIYALIIQVRCDRSLTER